LQLDKEIEHFAGQFMTQLDRTDGFQVFHGLKAGIAEQLDRIEQQATNLRGWAARGMQFCRDELAKDLSSPELSSTAPPQGPTRRLAQAVRRWRWFRWKMTLSALRRPCAFWISVCNVIGLACSMVGVVLLFWYALPNEPPGGPGILAGGAAGQRGKRSGSFTTAMRIVA
jgi:hypothetical protein